MVKRYPGTAKVAKPVGILINGSLENVSRKQREREREHISILQFVQMTTTAEAGLDPSQELEHLFRSPTWTAGIQALDPPSAAC